MLVIATSSNVTKLGIYAGLHILKHGLSTDTSLIAKYVHQTTIMASYRLWTRDVCNTWVDTFP